MNNRNIVVQFRVGWAGNDFDVMAQIFKGPAQVFQVNALTAAMGVAAVAQQTYAQGCGVVFE